jgi:prolyl-tRNA editing enzyme YbaK/EbsC (Cys-tRNA(Pro) deacylase)
VGHINPIRAWFDPRLLAFELVYAAAGTPRHVFAIAPGALLDMSGAIKANFTAQPTDKY